ncbi:MAG: carboxylating nicotinate-nucleotide diphosphorylase [Verrucomicrobiota bacterium]|nr:carboxylating nicotinate-nucleotide diphosphorylase [Verrucomicrobiota bacterium]
MDDKGLFGFWLQTVGSLAKTSLMPEALAKDDYLPLIKSALSEDIGSGDVTTNALIPQDSFASGAMIAKEPLVVAGIDLAIASFKELDDSVDFSVEVLDGQDGDFFQPLLRIHGPARALLTAERTALNFLQRLSGIATLTAKYVKQVEGTRAKILDTRKTIPGWRILEKYAVVCGGGMNHRIGLYDQAMVKDNHLVAVGGNIIEAVLRIRENYPDIKVEVEADTVQQAQSAAEAGADIILLDNMSYDELRQSVELINGRSSTEASGGITMETVREVAETGVDYISIGALTHSAPSVDIGFNFD